MSILLQDRSPQSGQTQPGSNLFKSTKWTDPTKVTNLHKSTKWTDTTKGQDQSTKWTDPTRVKLIQVHKVDGPHQGSKPVHKMDGPNQGQTYTSPQSERTRPGSQTYINIRSGRTQPGHKIMLVHEVGDHTKGHDPIPRIEWTQPWSLIQNPQWTNELMSRPIHKVDGPNHCQLI